LAGRRFLVEGRVQGVFFRASTAREARSLGLSGHAVNLPDGRVEVVAWGSDSALDRLARWLAEGPDLARVASLSEERLASPPDPLPEGFSTG
jgi:acylphosphatase